MDLTEEKKILLKEYILCNSSDYPTITEDIRDFIFLKEENGYIHFVVEFNNHKTVTNILIFVAIESTDFLMFCRYSKIHKIYMKITNKK